MTTDGKVILGVLLAAILAFVIWQHAEASVEPLYEECGYYPTTQCKYDVATRRQRYGY